MKNRAKCKLCKDVIESFHPTDYVICKCGEIGVDGGDSLRCVAKDWKNFVRIDDEGNEIIPVVKAKQVGVLNTIEKKPTKQELLEMLSEMIKSYESLPQAAMTQPITHYDLLSVLLLVSSIFRSED